MCARIPLVVRNILIAVGVCSLVAPLAATSASAADEDVVIVETKIPYIVENPTNPASNYIQINGNGSIAISQSATTLTDIKPQCVLSEASGGNTLCVGQQSAIDPNQAALTVGGVGDFLASNGADHLSALGWLMREAVDAVTALYDLPYDGRVARYAADQVRAYMVTRILDIFDKSLYGEALTADEQKTFDYVSANFLRMDQRIARWANEEYEAFMALECGYAPAPAPSFIPAAVPLPTTVTDWCSRRHTVLESAFVFTPPLPSVEHFQAWGLYRHADELGLSRLATPELQDAMGDTYRTVIALSGMGAAAAGAVVAGAAVGATVTGASFMAGAIGSGTVMASNLISLSAQAAAVTTMGAISAASIVAIVVLAVVITAIAIWKLVEYEEVGRTLRQRVADADAAVDPFGLDLIRDQFESLPLREGMTAENLPAYRTQGSIARIVEIITGTTTAKFGGVYVPDTETLWSENATTADDYRFLITDSSGTRVADVLDVPIDDVDTTVRFSKGWMIVDIGDGEKPALEFGYIDPEGNTALVTRAPAAVGASPSRTTNPDGPLTSESRTSIEFLDRNGDLVTAQLVGQSTSGLGGRCRVRSARCTPGAR